MSNVTSGIYASTDPTAPQVSFDRISSEDFQRVKLGWGPEGAYHDTADVDGERVPVEATHGGAFTNRSGAITTGGTAQPAASANSTRHHLFVQNPTTAAESFWINFDGTPAVTDSPSIEVPIGATLVWEGSFVPTGAISVNAVTTGTKFTIKEA